MLKKNDTSKKIEPQVLSDKDILQKFDIDMTTMRRMFKEVEDIENTPNIILYDDFIPFIPLFKNIDREKISTSQMDELKALGERYLKLIDMYKITHIVDSDGEVILKLPRLFVSLDTPDTQENDIKSAKNIILSGTVYNKITNDPIGREYIDSILEYQDSNNMAQKIKDAYKETAECIKDFIDAKAGIPKQEAHTKPSIIDWEFEDDK